MQWESIGICHGGAIPDENDWMVTQLQMAIPYLTHVCGPPPDGCKLDIRWRKHFDYNIESPEIALYWSIATRRDAPWAYIMKCRKALEILADAVDWSQIHPDLVREQIGDIDDNDYNEDDEKDE